MNQKLTEVVNFATTRLRAETGQEACPLPIYKFSANLSFFSVLQSHLPNDGNPETDPPFPRGAAHFVTMWLYMSDPCANSQHELLRRWVDTWGQAGQELDEVRRREIESADTQEAVRQLFGTGDDPIDIPPPPATSGLVDQQAWFAKMRAPDPRR